MKRSNIYLPMAALILTAALAVPAAAQKSVKMRFSGTVEGQPAIKLQPDTNTDEENVAGNGTLGPFTFRGLRADETIPQSFGRCGDGSGPILRVVAGGGVFRFQEGSLLTVKLTEGSSLCIDFAALLGHLTVTYQITGGTERFKDASGNLTLTATWSPVLFNSNNVAVLLTSTGELEGTVSGVSEEQGQDEGQ